MRGAHDDGSHGSKCLGGLKPTGGAIAGMAQRARGLAAADSREAEPQREASCELARDDQRAGNDHERREDTQKGPFALSSQFFGIRSRRISGPIRRPAAPRPAEAVVFPWHLISNAVVQMFRCSVFLRLLTRAMEQHVDTHRFTMQVAAGSSRMNG